jgi:cellulose synthase/poly-beta-1,6-N-acetylglucosamine synthase-like glycosyltransferase
MSPRPLVSVIIPHLNEPDDLRRCLDSLEKQKADGIPFEVIVVDNGSRELPTEVCAGVGLESEPCPGPGLARNRGAGVAQAEILAFIDADCVAETGWVRGIVEFFDRHPDVDCIAGDIRVARADPNRPTAIEAYEGIFSYRVKLYVERQHFATTGNMAVRRTTFQAVGPFGGIAMMEDNDWGQRATAKGFRIAYAPKVRVSTQPCRTFAELTRRWDRHIAHAFNQSARHPVAIGKWIARSLMIAASPAGEIVRIVLSDKVSSPRERWLALVCLTRVRLYRARKMLALALTGDSTPLVAKWNRD